MSAAEAPQGRGSPPEHAAEAYRGRGSPPELWCIGNALVDIFAEVDGDPGELFGLHAPVQHLEHEKTAEILTFLNEFTAAAGGGAVNVAKIAAFLGISAGFIGAVGSRPEQPSRPDHFARLFEEELSAAGLSLRLSRSPDPTGVFIRLQNAEGESRIAVSPSAALELGAEDIPEEILRQARAVALDGYVLGREALVRRVLELADRYGTPIALDLGSVDMARTWGGEILRYCREYPLILFMNEEEAAALYETLGSPGAEDAGEEERRLIFPAGDRRRQWPLLRRLCSFFQSLTAGELFPVIVVKRGPRGAVVFAGGEIHRAGTLAIIPLETTGAGDAFCAAFMAAWIRNKSLAECAGLGNRAAREVLDVPGTKIDPKRLAPLIKQLQ